MNVWNPKMSVELMPIVRMRFHIILALVMKDLFLQLEWKLSVRETTLHVKVTCCSHPVLQH